ncbi:ABC transporter permease [Galbitalea sp. SE-J8]|uniref:ABC transporter permease n=1 Tax=Galbitalea sp. SE-J8 TaxID=3054952 RepID=UPI00259C6FAA|nr:ABC transporter permease [Galbitalea sp. SE-J8]MDM4762998.1 ABC transporter permease [Galbitalea sp. SE-J8]
MSAPEPSNLATGGIFAIRRSRAPRLPRAGSTTSGRTLPYWLVLPMVVSIGLVFLYPLVQMTVSTLFVTGADGSARFTLAPFVDLLGSRRGWDLVARTLRVATVSTLATLVLALPITLWIREAKPRLRGVLIVIMLSPMLTSDVVRSLGWVSILGANGLIAGVLRFVGIEPPRILYTEAAIDIGLTQIFLGYMVLSLLSSALRISEDLVNAASDLGARRLQILGRLVLPLCRPGMIAGCAIVFPLAASTYVTASLLGGTSNPVLGTELYLSAITNLDWARASAVGIVLFILIAVVVAAINLLGRVATSEVQR